jgi:hypothetical protein
MESMMKMRRSCHILAGDVNKERRLVVAGEGSEPVWIGGVELHPSEPV